MRFNRTLLALAAFAAATVAHAADKPEGYLCCNMRSYGSEMSDINYDEEGMSIVPFGTPVKVAGQGPKKLRLLIGGKRHVLANDYSRDLGSARFTQRYVVAEDPRIAAAAFPDKIREAIASARLTAGMTREQVLMSLGYPISSENPDLAANVWRYWRSSFDEIQVAFDAGGRVSEISADVLTRQQVWVP